MRILVTGGAGFIGSHLVDQLVRQGHSVRVLDALVPQVHGENPCWPSWIPTEVEKLLGDVRTPAVWRRAIDGIDIVYHLAAEVGVGQSMYEITRYMDANTMGTAHLLQLLVQGQHTVRKLIVASSMSIYGEGAYHNGDGRIVYPTLRSQAALAARQWDNFAPEGDKLTPVPTAENKPLQPTSIYAISKRDQEEMCLSVGRAYNLPTTALRFFNVYGPRQALSNPYTGAVAIFCSRIMNGKPPLIFEDGQQSRDFVHVQDIVRALILAMDCPQADYEVFNIGTGQPTTISQVAERLLKTLGGPSSPVIANQYRAGDIRHCFADIGKARKLLGYEPSISFAAGIGDLVEWLQQQHAEDRVDLATAELAARGLTF